MGGWADVERRAQASPSTRFRIYSVARPMTSVLALRLPGADRLRLEAPIGESLEDLPPALSTVTR